MEISREIKMKCSLCCEVNTCSIALGVPICCACWNQETKTFKTNKEGRINFFPEIDEITEKIFLGNEDAQRNKEKLKKLGITHILVVGSGLDIFHPTDFEYKKFDINDFPDENISKYFQEAYNFIENSGKVFVHCAAGISRSATIVISYFMKKNNLNYEEALNLVAIKRPVIYPNLGFVKQLKDYKP